MRAALLTLLLALPASAVPAPAPADRDARIRELMEIDGTVEHFNDLLMSFHRACEAKRGTLPIETPEDFCGSSIASFDTKPTRAAIAARYAAEYSDAEIAAALAFLREPEMTALREGAPKLRVATDRAMRELVRDVKALVASAPAAVPPAAAAAAPPAWVWPLLRERGAGSDAELRVLLEQVARRAAPAPDERWAKPDVQAALGRAASRLETGVVEVYGDDGPAIAKALDSPEARTEEARHRRIRPALDELAGTFTQELGEHLNRKVAGEAAKQGR